MLAKSTFDFLKLLKKNNNRVWFEKNKQKYLDAKQNIEESVQEIIIALGKHDKNIAHLQAKKCMFRIYRDVRFSKDKSPYKSNLGASLSYGNKKIASAGYYIHIQPGASFVAGGIYVPDAPVLYKIRQEIDYNAKNFLKIIQNKKFKTLFGKFYDGDALKNNPKGYDKTHPQIEYLKLRHFIVSHDLKDAAMMKKDFAKKIAEVMKEVKPLNEFIQKSIA